jgi:YidC/Oxa1 family membrane protein insertase
MISTIFNTFFYQPLYNGFIFLFDALPWIDAGIAVILFTAIVKLALFPLSKKSVMTQLQMKDVQKELDEVKRQFPKREEQALAVMRVYKERNINPFAGIILLFIQLPIIFALYFVFLKAGLPAINLELLYAWVPVPDAINVQFLSTLDVTQKSAIIAFLAALSQFFQVRFGMPVQSFPERKAGEKPSFSVELQKSMQVQMRYVLPVIIFFIARSLPAVVGLYWVTSNLFAIGQELYLRKKLKKA